MSKGKKGGAAGDGESPFETLMNIYPKKFKQNDIPMYHAFDEKMKLLMDEDGELVQLHLWEPTNPNAIQAIFAAIHDAKIDTLISIRFWKIKAQDEGIRAQSTYMIANKTVEVVDVLDNEITPLGCEFLGRAIHPTVNLTQKKLNMDHNVFRDEGLRQLNYGLAINPNIMHLSLTYCGLTELSAKFLQQILAFSESKIEYLSLQGNELGNIGVKALLEAVKINTVITELGLSDNQFGEKCVDDIVDVVKNVPQMFCIDIRHNGIYEEGAEKIFKACEIKKTTKIEMSLEQPIELANKINAFMLKIKPKKKKGKKGMMMK